jgi:hypothetical protein
MSASTGRRQSTPAANSSGPGSSQATMRTSFFQSDTFPPVAQYVNRATYLLSQGKPAAQIGVYFPTFSMWYGDNVSNISLLDISRQLMENQCDFDFVDEQAFSSVLIQENGTLKNLSGQSYKTIIIPSVTVISKSALDKLQKFSVSGGKVIFIGTLPSLLVDKSFLKGVNIGDLTWATHEESGNVTPKVIEALPAPDLTIDKILPQLKYLHRRLKDADLFFIFNESEEPQSFNITLQGKGKSEVWNAFTGKITTLKGTALFLGPWETKFIMKRK